MQSSVQALSILFLCLALWAYGSFAAILPWTSEVIARMQSVKDLSSLSYRKKHYQDIHEIIKDRYKKKMPLREEGSFNDPWNASMLVCMVFLFLIACCEKNACRFYISGSFHL